MEWLSGNLSNTVSSLPFFVPEIYLTALFLLILLTDLFYGKHSAWICRALAIGGLALVLFKDLQQLAIISFGPRFLFTQMLFLHRTAISFKLIIDFFAIILLVYSGLDKGLVLYKKGLSDAYSIIVASVLGLHLMVMSVNFLSVYAAVEMVSLASYLLVAYRTENKLGAEAGLKYVLFGAAASAVMLYGISLLYAFTGSLDFYSEGFVASLSALHPAAAGLALMLVLAGIGFKLSFIPMHFWVPDVYQGAPTPITAYLSTLPKIAGFGLLINFLTPFLFFGKWASFDFRTILSVIGIVTMIAGNFAAVIQINVKRMLAYSSIGHTGFALMAVVTFSQQGVAALTFYLAAYAFANIAALMLASWYEETAGATTLDGYKSLGAKYPLAGVCFVVVLVSLTGIPVSVGFNAKVLVFSSVYPVYQKTKDVWLLLLLITGAVTTVISLFYYIKIPLYLFLKKPENPKPETKQQQSKWLFCAIMVLTALTLLLGIFPGWLAAWL